MHYRRYHIPQCTNPPDVYIREKSYMPILCRYFSQYTNPLMHIADICTTYGPGEEGVRRSPCSGPSSTLGASASLSGDGPQTATVHAGYSPNPTAALVLGPFSPSPYPSSPTSFPLHSLSTLLAAFLARPRRLLAICYTPSGASTAIHPESPAQAGHFEPPPADMHTYLPIYQYEATLLCSRLYPYLAALRRGRLKCRICLWRMT